MHDKGMAHIIHSPTVLSMSTGVNIGATGLTTSLAIYHGFSSQFIQDLQGVAQASLTFLGQTDSLATAVL